MTSSEPLYLFVYGTLRSGFDHPVRNEIENDIEFIGISQIKGKLYDNGDYPAALPAEENENSFIKGEVLKLNNTEVLKALDEYEGYNANRPDQSEYYRKQENIVLPDGRKIKAWVYWYNFPIKGKQRIRHKDYLDYLKTKKIA